LFASIVSCLEELSDTVEAQGLLIHMTKIDFAVSLAMFDELLLIIHVPHKVLQAKNSYVHTAMNVAEKVIVTLEKFRSNAIEWNNIWNNAMLLHTQAKGRSTENILNKLIKLNIS